MRRFPLLLCAAFLAVATLAKAADAPVTTKAPVPPASNSAPAAAAAKAASTTGPAETVSSSPVGTATAPASALTDAQRAAVEDIIKDYLTKKNPEVLMQALQELQKRETADSDAKSKTALTTDHDKIFNDPMTPIGGNPKGAVTVVEFFDYQCGYCKMSEPHIQKLLKENKEVKFIYKDFPVLGDSSTLAAKAALAAAKQGKYVQYHDALMSAAFSHGSRPQDDEKTVYTTAKNVGLDVEKLKKDMNDDSIDKQLKDNVQLGMDVGARGTPTFIIGDAVYPGAMEYDQLKKSVDDAAAAVKKP